MNYQNNGQPRFLNFFSYIKYIIFIINIIPLISYSEYTIKIKEKTEITLGGELETKFKTTKSKSDTNLTFNLANAKIAIKPFNFSNSITIRRLKQ